MKKPIVNITREAFDRIRSVVEASALEVSMLCEVESPKNGGFIINKVYIPEQTRSPAFTKITNNGIAQLLMTDGVSPEKLKCWIHSHVNMGVSPSGQDIAQAKELMEDAEWFIRGIFNKKGEYSLTIHWRGMEVDAELATLPMGRDLEAVKAEIEAVTVTEAIVIPSFTRYDKYERSDGFYPLVTKREKGKGKTRGVTIFTREIDKLEERFEDIDLSAKELNWQIDDFETYRDKHKDMGMQDVIKAYETYLDNIESGLGITVAYGGR